MKNKKGFTLVELLAIIVILGIIAVIAAPNINKQLSQSEENNKTILSKKIENASKIYAAKYYADDIVENKEVTFSLQSVVDDGLLNLGSGECRDDDDKIIGEISINNGTFDYTNMEGCYMNE